MSRSRIVRCDGSTKRADISLYVLQDRPGITVKRARPGIQRARPGIQLAGPGIQLAGPSSACGPASTRPGIQRAAQRGGPASSARGPA